MDSYGPMDRANTYTDESIYEVRRRQRQNACITSCLVAIGFACLFGVCDAALYLGRTGGGSCAVATERINPNTASAPSLMRLQNIGPSRAAAIVEYRASQSSGSAVFTCPDDLQKVKGIGPATVNGIREQLCFD